MKIQKEHFFTITIGLFLLSYLLERIVSPLRIHLPTPYAFLNPSQFSKYPFTAVVVVIRAISLFMMPLFLLSFIKDRYFAKLGILLILSSLSQLYSLQQLISGNTLIPLEWAISLSIAGALILIPVVMFGLKGILSAAKDKIGEATLSFEDIDSED